jgi:hypothetical protein
MLDDLENQDASNPEGDQDTTPESESNDEANEAAKAKEYAKNQKIRAEKAEAEVKKWKAEAEKATKGNSKITLGESETPKSSEQLNEPDYAKLAYLESRGIKHPDDQKIVRDEANRLKLPLTDVLGMEHIQTKLKKSQTQREAEDGMPQGSGKPKGGNKGAVDYWVDRKNPDGTYETPTDTELAEKVIDARLKKDKASSQFSDILY